MANALEEFTTEMRLDKDDLALLRKIAIKVTPALDAAIDAFYSEIPPDVDLAVFAGAKAAMKDHWARLLKSGLEGQYPASIRRLNDVHFLDMGWRIEAFMAGHAAAAALLQAELVAQSGLVIFARGKARLAQEAALLSRLLQLDLAAAATAFTHARKTKQAVAFEYLERGMKRVAAKDLSEDIPAPQVSDFPQEFEPLRFAFNELQRGLRSVVKTIKYATDDLNLTASEMNESAGDLARRTETQAATLERTAASISDISTQLQSSSDATQKTDAMMRQTHAQAQTGRSVMGETVGKMREIAQSSAQISQITGVIDDIAFQTNLLALNAGVEAARAGEAGRGFAVVASEVRGLAQKAGDAAKEISELIKTSSELVETGVTLVDQAGSVLEDIVQDVENVSALSTEVAQSTSVQSDGLSEIANGLGLLDEATQQNAALVEEVVAVVDNMRRDTSQVSEIVKKFETRATEEDTPIEIFASTRAA
ncbi:methyl-accepting chemotaxis protein [Shimia sp. MMG029]|uniref:methyl-accepting chemotaxis protein n=1 Tax=Shimia sp. MMG029 TaxID=3021978 RepID=UPI0022FEE0FE|nr:methyl-accepting chemotaxis protein [Shimia sp. MMG029]MDA5556999.1 methyl-accepting chemotaxis protein [Shimia sp. MMG029]